MKSVEVIAGFFVKAFHAACGVGKKRIEAEGQLINFAHDDKIARTNSCVQKAITPIVTRKYGVSIYEDYPKLTRSRPIHQQRTTADFEHISQRG